ncbi:vitelline membrane protein 15a-2-like [Schistocerca serialis cubense]|uniref:vitelline membrane protein 15a-2-like n=1 Tax=Schistocerca serialis cubense TaxID=2023355 RepID=UPI00214E6DB6|nr:vitelline membrane protein 15a-2-like [Schistocerca serialis cubense]
MRQTPAPLGAARPAPALPPPPPPPPPPPYSLSRPQRCAHHFPCPRPSVCTAPAKTTTVQGRSPAAAEESLKTAHPLDTLSSQVVDIILGAGLTEMAAQTAIGFLLSCNLAATRVTLKL